VAPFHIVVPDDFPPVLSGSPAEARLRELGEVTVYPSLAPEPETLLERIRDADAVVNIRASSRFTRWVLERCPRLKHIAVFGVGVDNLDLEACRDLGIAVSNTPGYSAESVAETALALALAVARRIPQNDRAVREGRWAREPVVQLAGKTLGVVGAGPIGQRMMALGRCLGMRVLAWTFHPSPERARALGVEFVPLERLLEESDVVSLHLPLTPQSRGLIGWDQLARMKPTAILVNTARGAIVDEDALVSALREGRLYGAGLDVFAVEPLPPDHPLTRLENVVLSPHTGALSPEAGRKGVMMAVENLALWLQGRPRHLVVEGRRPPEDP